LRSAASTLFEANDAGFVVKHLRHWFQIVATARPAIAQHHRKPLACLHGPKPSAITDDEIFTLPHAGVISPQSLLESQHRAAEYLPEET
jgi:hypothetical protein